MNLANLDWGEVKQGTKAVWAGEGETYFEGAKAATSHVELTDKQRQELGIPESLIRCSVGIEDIEDIIDDFSQAIAKT